MYIGFKIYYSAFIFLTISGRWVFSSPDYINIILCVIYAFVPSNLKIRVFELILRDVYSLYDYVDGILLAVSLSNILPHFFLD